MKESDIVAEAGNYWVYKDKRGYHVMRPDIKEKFFEEEDWKKDPWLAGA